MSHSIRLSSRSQKELDQANLWYEEQAEGLWKRFMNNVNAVLISIEKNPLLYPEKKNWLKEVAMKVFPYTIVYKIQKKGIVIHTIFHTSQNPNKKYLVE